RLPLELALVKVTRPAADLSREATAYRLEQLEERGLSGPVPVPGTGTSPPETPSEQAPAREPPAVDLEQLQEVWQRAVLPAGEDDLVSLIKETFDAREVEE